MAHRRLPLHKRIPCCWHLDSGLLLALALALIAALPFLARPGLPRGTDAELHVFRAAELGYSLQAGILYPRWAPDLYYGYGYPIFNYYAPFTYYLANFFDLLPGTSIVTGVKLVFILGLIGASLGSYLFVRDRIGARAGLLAAALYVFSPYVLLVDPHMRGVLAESFILGLFPLVLWAFARLLTDGRCRWLALAAIFQAALIMSHNLLGVVFTAMLLAYLTWELGSHLIQNWRQMRPRVALALCWPLFGRVLASLALGVGLSAIFWLPVAMERNLVHLNLTGPGHFDFHNHFLTLGALLAPSPILDLGATAPRIGFNLGVPQWSLAFLALPALVWGSRAVRRLSGFFVLFSVCLATLMLPVSTWIWEAVPGMALLQFPWRLLGPSGATLSISAAAGFACFASSSRNPTGSERHWRRGAVALGLCTAVTLWQALPAMYPPLWEPDFGPTDAVAMIDYELTGVAVGTTSTGDYVPTTVEILPHPEPAYLSTYTVDGFADKVNRVTLPEGTSVETISHGPTHDRFHVDSDRAFILRLFTFYFPGWRATIDNQHVPIELGRPEGFITVAVPPGVHTVEVRLEALATPARSIGTVISLCSLVMVFLIALSVNRVSFYRRLSSLVRRTDRKPPSRCVVPSRERAFITEPSGESGSGKKPSRIDRMAWWSVGSVLLVFVIVKLVVIDWQHDWFRRTSPSGQVIDAQYSLADVPVDFGHEIQLLGYDLPRVTVRAGDMLPVTLYWRATTPVQENYQVFAHLTRPSTHLWGQSDNLNPGDLPTRRWPLGKYVRDEHELDTLPGTPPGEYQLTVGLYTLSDGARVAVFDADGAPLGDTFTLQTPITVTRPRNPPDQDALGMTDEIDAEYKGQLTLLGAVFPDRQIELPGFIHLALLWRADVDRPGDIMVVLQMVDADGRVVDQITTRPVDGHYPSSFWSAGEIVRDQYSFWLREDFEPGRYDMRAGLNGVDSWLALGRIEVLKP